MVLEDGAFDDPPQPNLMDVKVTVPYFDRPHVSTHLNFKMIIFHLYLPGNFVTKVKQMNSQLDLIPIWKFCWPGPSYLTIRSSVYIILI